jgi:hypothetical protein
VSFGSQRLSPRPARDEHDHGIAVLILFNDLLPDVVSYEEDLGAFADAPTLVSSGPHLKTSLNPSGSRLCGPSEGLEVYTLVRSNEN